MSLVRGYDWNEIIWVPLQKWLLTTKNCLEWNRTPWQYLSSCHGKGSITMHWDQFSGRMENTSLYLFNSWSSFCTSKPLLHAMVLHSITLKFEFYQPCYFSGYSYRYIFALSKIFLRIILIRLKSSSLLNFGLSIRNTLRTVNIAIFCFYFISEMKKYL